MERTHGAPTMNAVALDSLQRELGHTFRRGELLLRAVTHSSLAFEQATENGAEKGDKAAPEGTIADNEQLEFLGDAVLGLLVAECLCTSFPEFEEVDLTRLSATRVTPKLLGQGSHVLQL